MILANSRAHLVDIVTGGSGHVPLISNPMLLSLHLPTALDDRVSGQLAHVRGSQLVDLRSTAVLLQQVRSREMELKRVV